MSSGFSPQQGQKQGDHKRARNGGQGKVGGEEKTKLTWSPPGVVTSLLHQPELLGGSQVRFRVPVKGNPMEDPAYGPRWREEITCSHGWPLTLNI